MPRRPLSVETPAPIRIGAVVLESPFVLAPMRRITKVAFRRLCKEHGAALTFTDCINARSVVERSSRQRAKRYLQFSPEERPIGAQISSGIPEMAADAARIVASLGFDLVDLNFGCPWRGNDPADGGAPRMLEPKLIGQVVAAVRAAVDPLPVTVKIRAGWESNNAAEVARVVEDEGAALVTVHGRLATQGYLGRSDPRVIAEVKAAVQIPVIGNGDVTTPSEAIALMEGTGCDGVMIGRGAYGNPWVFERANTAFRTGVVPPEPTASDRARAVLRYLELAMAHGDFPRDVSDVAHRFHSVIAPRHRQTFAASPAAESDFWTALLAVERKLRAARAAIRNSPGASKST